MTAFPPAELTCPRPRTCPVTPPVLHWTTVEIRLDEATWYRAYDGTWGYDEYNPGYGDARFSPLDSIDGRRVPSMYVAADETAALLETIFHSVDDATSGDALTAPVVHQEHLREWLVVALASDLTMTLADFRDLALAALRLRRTQLITSPAEHYPCTRRFATAIHADPRTVDGIIWHSRQTELTGHGKVETIMLFGDRHPSDRGRWERRSAGSRNLYEGAGRDLVERTAASLGTRII